MDLNQDKIQEPVEISQDAGGKRQAAQLELTEEEKEAQKKKDEAEKAQKKKMEEMGEQFECGICYDIMH